MGPGKVNPKTRKSGIPNPNGYSSAQAYVKPFETGWRVHMKLLHSWTQKIGYVLEYIPTDDTVSLIFFIIYSPINVKKNY